MTKKNTVNQGLIGQWGLFQPDRENFKKFMLKTGMGPTMIKIGTSIEFDVKIAHEGDGKKIRISLLTGFKKHGKGRQMKLWSNSFNMYDGKPKKYISLDSRTIKSTFEVDDDGFFVEKQIFGDDRISYVRCRLEDGHMILNYECEDVMVTQKFKKR